MLTQRKINKKYNQNLNEVISQDGQEKTAKKL